MWDNYSATTYPNSGAAANTFVCHRASTAVPFSINNVRSIPSVGAGGVDPHIGEELANGHVILYHIDFVVTNNAIVKADLDPLTGTLGSTSMVVQYTSTFAGFHHSPFVHRDSTGKARAINYSEYAVGGIASAYFSEGIANDGTPEMIIDGSSVVTPTATNTWYNNPGLIGGSWHYTTGAVTEPQLQEVTMIANATAQAGTIRIAAWAPARPLATNTDFFFSVVAIGINAGWLSLPEYPIPPVLGNAYLYPSLGVLPFSLHDPFTGLVEWSFAVPTPSPGWQFDMQVFTLDTSNVSIHAGNNAVLNI